MSEDQSADDVTGQVIDVAARISAQRASVARIRALLAKATTLGQVVQVEGELTTRQAALESLEGQAAALADQTSLATATVTIVGPKAVVTVAKPAPAAHRVRGRAQQGLARVLRRRDLAADHARRAAALPRAAGAARDRRLRPRPAAGPGRWRPSRLWRASGRPTASRSIGQVMQRGPPRPRPSSLPATATMSMPFLRR